MKGGTAAIVLFLALLMSSAINVLLWRKVKEMERRSTGLVQHIAPSPSDSMRVRVDTVVVRDSIYVEIPIFQTTYKSDDYIAHVSGFHARLDSLSVFPNTLIIKDKNGRRWTVGLTGGYGITPAGLQPYVGIGFSYRLF